MTPDSASILHDLDLLDDWLNAKGYGEEAGLVLRAMTLINAQARELRKLRASKHDLEDARELRALRVENETHKEIAVRETMKVATLRAALKLFHPYSIPKNAANTDDLPVLIGDLRAAAAALKETE